MGAFPGLGRAVMGKPGIAPASGMAAASAALGIRDPRRPGESPRTRLSPVKEQPAPLVGEPIKRGRRGFASLAAGETPLLGAY